MTQVKKEFIIKDLGDANRCVRDLVALSTLPAIWVGGDVRQIACGICDALFGMLRPILIYAGIRIEPTHLTVEAARTADGYLADAAAQDIGRGFTPWLKSKETATAFSIPNPISPGMARMTFVPVGHSGVHGFIVAVSHLVHFPSEAERLLLTVGANQAAVAIENARLLAAQRTAAHYRGTVTRLRSCLRDIRYRPDEPKTLTVDRLAELLKRKPHGERLVDVLGELHDFAPDRDVAREMNPGDIARYPLRDPSDST